MAHSTPTNQKPSNAPIFVHSSAGTQHPKDKPTMGGWGSKREGSATRGNTTTRLRIKRQLHIKQLWRNKKPCKNQPGKWEAMAGQEVLIHQEAERWLDYR